MVSVVPVVWIPAAALGMLAYGMMFWALVLGLLRPAWALSMLETLMQRSKSVSLIFCCAGLLITFMLQEVFQSGQSNRVGLGQASGLWLGVVAIALLLIAHACCSSSAFAWQVGARRNSLRICLGLILWAVSLVLGTLAWFACWCSAWIPSALPLWVCANSLSLGIIWIHMHRIGGQAQGDATSEVDLRPSRLLWFTVLAFAAYLEFASYLVVWMGGLPEELAFYKGRDNLYGRLLLEVAALGRFSILPLLLISCGQDRVYCLSRFTGLAFLTGVCAWLGWMVSYHTGGPFVLLGVGLAFVGALFLTGAQRWLAGKPARSLS